MYRGELRSDRDVAVPGLWQRVTAALLGERAPERFRSPVGVGFDPSGRLLVTDVGRHALLILDRDAIGAKAR